MRDWKHNHEQHESDAQHGDRHAHGHRGYSFMWPGLPPLAFGRRRWHGHGPGRGRDWNWGDFFGDGGNWFWNWGRGWGAPGGGRGERMERGLLRHVILSVLKDGPKHGYEIIKHLEERTMGRYSPSPGTLYPTLQYLEDLGLVRSVQQGDKRVYEITEAGYAELDKQHSVVQGFWSRFEEGFPQGVNTHELKFASDALRDLLRTLVDGLRSGAYTGSPDVLRQIRASLERCQSEVRQIIAQSASGRPSSSEGEPTRRTGGTEDDMV